MSTTIRAFNAINGRELMEILLKEIRTQMEADFHFRVNLTYPLIAWNWKVCVDAYPSEPPKWEVTSGTKEIRATGVEGVPDVDPVQIDFTGGKTVAAPQGQTVDAARREANIPVPTPRKAPGPEGARMTVDAPHVEIPSTPARPSQTEEKKSETNIERGGKVFARSVVQRTAAAPDGVEAAPQQGSRPTAADVEKIIEREGENQE